MDEQLTLFDSPFLTKEQFADKLVSELNKLDTCWKGKFYVEEIRLEHWDHVALKEKVLEVSIKARNWRQDRAFTYFTGDRESQMVLYFCGDESAFFGKLFKDKDFSMSPTPWRIYVFYHNWEKKKIEC